MKSCIYCNEPLGDNYRIPIHMECEEKAQHESKLNDVNYLEELDYCGYWDYLDLIDQNKIDIDNFLNPQPSETLKDKTN